VPLIEGFTALLLLAGVPSGATVIICTTPAVPTAAEAMLKDSAFEVTPVDGSCTVMLAVPCAATSVLEPVINFVPLFTV
jgi:hypothetical protein